MHRGAFPPGLAVVILVVCAVWPATARAGAAFAPGASQGSVSIPALTEASGIAGSRDNTSVLWTHNDSGDTPRIFALDTQGRLLGTYTLPGATHVDYEDIALGPGPVSNVQYLYVGDIGDNAGSRPSVRVYQIPEPAVYSRQYLSPVNTNLAGLRAVTLTYPDGRHNAEALMVDPLTGDLFIATKHTGTSSIYRAPRALFNATNSLTLSFVRTINFDLVTGGDISPDGGEIVLRSLDIAQLWKRLPGQTIGDALGGTFVSIPVIGTPTEPQGEAIGFDAIGKGYFTVSEGAASQPLYYFQRTSPDAPPGLRTLVGAGSTWKYLDNGSNQGTAWEEPGFNDSLWPAGESMFGYGNGSERTIVSYGPNASNKFVTTYFRAAFVISNAPSITNLVLKLLYDDGAAVYLNGTPIVWAGLDSAAAYNTLATTNQNLKRVWFTYPVNPLVLVNGTNRLAVEVHQVSGNSPELSFDLQLLAMESPQPKMAPVGFGNGQFQAQIFGPDTGASMTVQASDDFTNWADLGSFSLTNGAALFSDPQAGSFTRRFYRTRQ